MAGVRAGYGCLLRVRALYHESRHLTNGASEAFAYEEEWRFVRATAGWARASAQVELAREVEEWEKEIQGGIEFYVGKSKLKEIEATSSQSWPCVNRSAELKLA